MARLGRLFHEKTRVSWFSREKMGLWSLGFLCLMLLAYSSPVLAQGNVASGIITANNVDITTDSGEVLSERLNVGDSIYVITNPGKVRRGWVRVSRSPNDSVGIGWIEEKNVRTFQRWDGGSSVPAPATPPPTPRDDFLDLSFKPEAFGGGAPSGSTVAVLAFSGSNPGETFLTNARKHFVTTLNQRGRVTLKSNVTGAGVNADSAADLKRLLEQNSLDGAFVGSVSPPIGGARLVKMKYFSGRDGAFTSEHVKRVSSESQLSSAMEELVKACVEDIAGF